MIETIKVENNKRCSHIEGLVIDKVAQLNLITGLNGIGKTTLLKYILENTPNTGIVYLGQDRKARATRQIFGHLLKDLWQRKLRPSDILPSFQEKFKDLNLEDNRAMKYIEGCLYWMPQKGGILLIDEIEQSLHHSLYSSLWLILTLLSKNFNFQVFATTHSLEMISVFANVAKVCNVVECALIEIARNDSTNELVSNYSDVDQILHYLDTEKGEGLRG
jgi:AAA15 family ATPase/GTPase